MEQANRDPALDKRFIVLGYVLMASGVFTMWLGSLAGAVVGYLLITPDRGWADSHYRVMIRTFWIGALYLFLGSLFWPLGVGAVVLFLIPVWVIARAIRGYLRSKDGDPYPEQKTWLV
ncbi:DUF4870 family protein [Ferrimonas marina]|uniref:Uncharacterized membrane protein n=1 Tax=Ferrimonas marina TaxID=299255 RepID=A0A1M5UC59_9GAMM|nr:hypothetical protein [Ferrimonas marina]SHH60602.1 Uncharacterized membrane protein [Ferrimonas marina]